jgi:hypothetical protein
MIKRLLSIFFLFSILFIPILSTAQENPDSTLVPLDKKSPMGALMRSVAFPGWGQFYNEKYLKAALIFGIETTYIVLAADEWRKTNFHKKNFQSAPPYSAEQYWEFDQYQFHRDRRNLYLWVVSGIVFLSMFDAYVDAHLYSFDKEKMEDLKVELLPEFDKGHGVKVLFSLNF